jgi:hypothetical protein
VDPTGGKFLCFDRGGQKVLRLCANGIALKYAFAVNFYKKIKDLKVKIDSILPLIGLFDPGVKFETGEDRVLKLFKRTMWASIALWTLKNLGWALFPSQMYNKPRRFCKYLCLAGEIALNLLIPSIFLTITEAARLKSNYNKRIPSAQ